MSSVQHASHMVENYPFEGAAALKPSRVPFIVLDGGLAAGSTPAAPTHELSSAPARSSYDEAFEAAEPASLRFSLAQKLACWAVAVLMGVIVIGGYLVVVRAHEAAVDALFQASTTIEVVVQPGESLWEIAAAHPIEGISTSELVEHIQASNGLTTATLTPGQTLHIPQEGV